MFVATCPSMHCSGWLRKHKIWQSPIRISIILCTDWVLYLLQGPSQEFTSTTTFQIPLLLLEVWQWVNILSWISWGVKEFAIHNNMCRCKSVCLLPTVPNSQLSSHRVQYVAPNPSTERWRAHNKLEEACTSNRINGNQSEPSSLLYTLGNICRSDLHSTRQWMI